MKEAVASVVAQTGIPSFSGCSALLPCRASLRFGFHHVHLPELHLHGFPMDQDRPPPRPNQCRPPVAMKEAIASVVAQTRVSASQRAQPAPVPMSGVAASPAGQTGEGSSALKIQLPI